MGKDIRIEIKGSEESSRDFIQAWHAVGQKESAEEPSNRIYFEDLEVLLKVLSPRRLEIIRVLHSSGPSSIRVLAKSLKRDYKNVHGDVVLLQKIGLIERQKDTIAVPWDRIVAEIRLAA